MYLTHNTKRVAVAVLLMLGVACSGSATSSSSSSGSVDEDAGSSGSSGSSGTSGTSGSSGDADAGTTQKDAATEPMPTSPLFDLTVNGVAMKVKSIKVSVEGGGQGSIQNYAIDATLEQTPAMLPGLMQDPHMIIRVGKDDTGAEACKEVRGPAVNFVEPTLQIRDVVIKYDRFTGSQEVIASLTTNGTYSAGSCSMNVKTPATNGKAWGEATGTLQTKNEPALNYSVKWFQDVTWNK